MTEKPLGLIADIGGTNARFALADQDGYHDELVLKCDDYPELVDAVEDYLQKISVEKRPQVAAFGVAGVVKGDQFNFTNNMPWSFSVKDVRTRLAFDQLNVMNDFKAIALSVPHLQDTDSQKIGGGKALKHESIGILGPGTGLGVAGLIWDGKKYVPVSGEGGHVLPPAPSQRMFDIFEIVRKHCQGLSTELVCSGIGLVNLYNALREIEDQKDLPDRTASEISNLAVQGSCTICKEALDTMIETFAIRASNLALTLNAYSGVYIAGGIPLKLGDYFIHSRFREIFETSSRRYETYLSDIPTYLITHPMPAFVGLQANLMGDQ